jgi:drug/metabolite transporter (DMT)-like permease
MAGLVIAVTLGVARAYQSGPPTLIAAVDNSYLVFAAGWGFVFFGEVPDRAGLLGLALIAAGGCAALVRRPEPGRPRPHSLSATGA